MDLPEIDMKTEKNLLQLGTSALLVLCIIIGLQLCNPASLSKKKIVYVNSYHSEFPPSKQITEGVFETLPEDSFEIVSFFIDSKRNPTEDFIMNQAVRILDFIKMEYPDLLIVSDDNAVKYLVEPNFQNDPLPIVFCGVNWTADQYDLSNCNITGVIELLPVAEATQVLKSYYPYMQDLLVLNENTTTSRKTKPLLDTLLSGMGITVFQELVDDFEGWKSAFVEGNNKFDAIYLQTCGGIKNWDHEEALRIIDLHIKVPLFTCEDFMMPYAVLGFTQVSKEQGIKAAEAAKKILHGADPADIPISRNTISKVWINTRLAEKIEFIPNEDLLGRATIVD
jgi:ABC-type uncharacterized transport system substrate-binding protein